MAQEKQKISYSKDELHSVENNLILFNDEFNSFDYVIETLIDICGHEPIQAEQCALITHYKGKCSVKSGSFAALKPIHDEMSRRNLSVEID